MSEPLPSAFDPRRARLWWGRQRAEGDVAAALVDGLVKDGHRAVDVGADWGFFTCRLAQLVGPRGRVHAFEPSPARRSILETIAALEPNVAVSHLALSDRSGRAPFRVPVHRGKAIWALGSISAPRAEAEDLTYMELEVSLETLDAALAGTGPVDFIKCDVEGHELAVLKGGERTLRRSLPTLLVEVEQRHHHESIDFVFSYLVGLGYAGSCVRDDGLSPLEDFDLERDQLAHLHGFQPAEMPAGYVNEFLFTRPDVDLGRWVARA